MWAVAVCLSEAIRTSGHVGSPYFAAWTAGWAVAVCLSEVIWASVHAGSPYFAAWTVGWVMAVCLSEVIRASVLAGILYLLHGLRGPLARPQDKGILRCGRRGHDPTG